MVDVHTHTPMHTNKHTDMVTLVKKSPESLEQMRKAASCVLAEHTMLALRVCFHLRETSDTVLLPAFRKEKVRDISKRNCNKINHAVRSDMTSFSILLPISPVTWSSSES